MGWGLGFFVGLVEGCVGGEIWFEFAVLGCSE